LLVFHSHTLKLLVQIIKENHCFYFHIIVRDAIHTNL
jgi:hypothetical protein